MALAGRAAATRGAAVRGSLVRADRRARCCGSSQAHAQSRGKASPERATRVRARSVPIVVRGVARLGPGFWVTGVLEEGGVSPLPPLLVRRARPRSAEGQWKQAN